MLLLPKNTYNEAAEWAEPKLRVRFLILNISYMMQRAACFGDSLAFLQGLREVSKSLHELINRGQIGTLAILNNVTSFPPKLSRGSVSRERVVC
jgi:hypothetical protein